jgi:Zn-dependent protease with chaperone function
MILEARSVSTLLAQVAVLLLPSVLTVGIRWVAVKSHEAEQRNVWTSYQKFSRFILISTVASWWVIWDAHGRLSLNSIIVSLWPRAVITPAGEILLFWAPPTMALGIFLLLCYMIDQRVFNLKWTIVSAFRQTWWRLISFVIPLLLVAAGFDALLDRKISGVVWLLVASVVSKVGTGFRRRAQGMKFNTLKSGELRNRAFSMASRMGVTIERVYFVPSGKGHLTNAYGMSNAIALTDNLGKILTKMQLEFVMAHELAHVKLKHARKYYLFLFAVFSVTALLLFSFPQRALPFWSLIQLIAMIGPFAAIYYWSRRFEYSADGEAVDFTGDPETAIWALATLHRSRELPTTLLKLAGLFATHPTIGQRVRAIAIGGNIPADRVTDILRETGHLG